MEETLDLMPRDIIKNNPEIEKVINLSENMKLLASEVLGAIEIDPTNNMFLTDTKDLDGCLEFTKANFRSDCVDALENDFEDAKSHVSSDNFEPVAEYNVEILANSEMPHRNCLPYLRDPRQKYNL